MDLVPTWLKRKGRVEVIKSVGSEVLIHGLIFLALNLLWYLMTTVFAV